MARDNNVLRAFEYKQAFARNIGWVTTEEQEKLRTKRVAIAGLGGVGGIELLTLARLGIERFSLADFDTFDIANFNRQAGATLSSLGRPKLDVMVDLVRDINPGIDVRLFPTGINSANVRQFLEGADIYVDALDYFAFEARLLVFRACSEMGIPVTTVAPLGMGAAMLNFLPGRMTFDEYFCLEGCDENEQALRLLVGLSPKLLWRPYLVDPSQVRFAGRGGPSTAMACQLCAGIAATEALKILLQRGRVYAAPWVVHFDAYRNTLRTTYRPFGNRNPLQRLVLAIARRHLRAKGAAVSSHSGER